MTHSTMYVAGEDGVLRPTFEYSNGWGSAPVIWEALCEKYRSWEIDTTGARLGVIAAGRPPHFSFLRGSALNALLAYHQHKDGQMRAWEHNCVLITRNCVLIEPQWYSVLVESLRMFEEAFAQPGRACHLAAMAADIERLGVEGRTRGVAWCHTSDGDFWGETIVRQGATEEELESCEDLAYSLDKHTGHWAPRLEKLKPGTFVAPQIRP